MTTAEAQLILAAWRPGMEATPEVRAALALAEQDAELGRWLARHGAFQAAVSERLRDVKPPAGLADRILAARKTAPFPREAAPPWRPWAWAAAAAVVLAGMLWAALRPTGADAFEVFRQRMVGTVLREYRMDSTTPDAAAVRRHLAGRGAPDAFALPAPLAAQPVLGGGRLEWREHPVAMVCFDRGGTTLFLFVVDRGALGRSAPGADVFSRVSRLETGAWSDARYTYVLAAALPSEQLRELIRRADGAGLDGHGAAHAAAGPPACASAAGLPHVGVGADGHALHEPGKVARFAGRQPERQHGGLGARRHAGAGVQPAAQLRVAVGK